MYSEIVNILGTTLKEATTKPLVTIEVIPSSGLLDTYIIYAAQNINGVVGYPVSRISLFTVTPKKTRFDQAWLVTSIDVKSDSAPLVTALQALTWS